MSDQTPLPRGKHKQPSNKRRLFFQEFLKNLRITRFGSTKLYVVVGIFVPVVFMLFMWTIFGTGTITYAAAVVVPDYSSDASLQADLAANHLPNTEMLIETFNDSNTGGGSVVAVGHSLDSYLDAYHTQSIDVIIVLPVGFEQAIAEDLNDTWTGGAITVTLYVANLNEDFTEFIQHSIDLKLKAYYDTVLTPNVIVNYTYESVNPQQNALPHLWSFGSSALVYGLLVVSIIIGAAYIFNEKQAKMLPELALASRSNQVTTYAGKFLAGAVFPFAIDFPVTLALIALWAQIPVLGNLPTIAACAILTILFGNAIGMLIGAVVPEIVFAVPTAVFLVLASLFLCGGFQDLRTMPLAYQQVVSFIPFTYCFSLTKVAMLGIGAWDWVQFTGLCIYTIVLFTVGTVVYRKRVIHG